MAKKKLGYVELEWTCPNCGTRNPGPEQSCVNCGSPQPDDVQFEQAQREELLTDEAVKEKVEAGADIHCPYCGTRNLANAEVCAKCGGDLVEGLKRESGRVVGAFKTDPASTGPCPRCGTENPDTAKQCAQCGSSLQIEDEAARQSPPPEVIEPAKKRNPLAVVAIIALLIVVCGVVAVLILLSMRMEAVTGTVQDVEWQRVVVVERLMPVEHRDWIDAIPSEAELGSCEEQVRTTSAERKPNSVEVCGTPYTVDTGSGFGEVVQDCEYQVYEEYCTYSIIEWQKVDEVVLTGGDFEPVWPAPVLAEDERLGSRQNETFTIVYDTGDEEYVYTTSDLNLFQASQIGSEWELNINTFGSIVSVEH